MIDLNTLLLNGEGYTIRDKKMFLAGVEYSTIQHYLEVDKQPVSRQIMNENVDRLMVLCNKLGRTLDIERIDEDYSYLMIY